MVWGSFLIAAAALKTLTRNGYNAQGVNLTFYVGLTLALTRGWTRVRVPRCRWCLGLYKIFFYCEAVVHESIILSFPAPPCIAQPGAIRLHDYWAAYDSSSKLAFVCYALYHIGNHNIV